MYLIVGLGNPEPEYSKTRHNMGFDVINKLAEKYNIDVKKEKFNGFYGNGIIENEKVILVKPQTYMNLSGEAVIQYANFYKIEPENIIIIYDDIDIETGITKIRKKGGPGTHNGMKSVVNFGKKPTIGDNLEPVVEAHILNFDKNIYNTDIEIKFIKKIRDEKKFNSLEELTEQINKDIKEC